MRDGTSSYFVGIRGEFLVLAELAKRGILAAPTLGAAKQVDILVAARGKRRAIKVEVKTKKEGEQHGKFGRHFGWLMSVKNQENKDRDLVYCFVRIDPETDTPRYFLLHAREVVRCIAWGHRLWRRNSKIRNPQSTTRELKLSLVSRPERQKKENRKRYPFLKTYPLKDAEEYEDDWSIFNG